MKPPAFEYLAASSVDEAVAALAAHEGEAKIIAGGQSLVPMLNFRLLAPTVLIDINRVDGLSYIEPDGDGLRIGALTRHHALETSDLVRERFPVAAACRTPWAMWRIWRSATGARSGGACPMRTRRRNCR